MTTVEEKSSAALAEPLRGSWYIYYDYWFADQGILKVRVLSPAVYVSMLVGWLVFVEVLIKYVGGVSTYFRVLEFGGLMLLIAVSLVRVRRKRRKLSNLRLEDLLARSDAVLIPWTTLASVKMDDRLLKFTSAGHKYKAKVREHQVELLQKVLESKTEKSIGVG